MIARLISISLLFLTSLVSLQAKVPDRKHPDSPMLWKIEGKGLTSPSYLFGTIHLPNPEITTLHPAAKKAFESASSLHTEVDLSFAAQMKASQLMLRNDGKTLSQSIGKELTKELDTALAKVNPELNSRPLGRLKTWAAAVMVPMLEHQMGEQQPFDLQLYQRAQKAGKRTEAMETLKGQLGRFDKLNEEEQKALLKSSLKSFLEAKNGGKDLLAELKEAYLKGDEVEISKLIDESGFSGKDGDLPAELSKKIMQLILIDRNIDMTESVKNQLTDKPDESHFFAAGTAHYLGEESVTELLRKSGYTITRIKE